MIKISTNKKNSIYSMKLKYNKNKINFIKNIITTSYNRTDLQKLNLKLLGEIDRQ